MAISLEQVLLPLTAALGMALIVERVVEFLKNLVDVIPTTSTGAIVERPEVSEREVAKLKGFYAAADNAESEWMEQHPPETILVQDATDPDDGTTLRVFVIQSVAVITGILAARVSGLQLFHALAPGADIGIATDFLLTGLFIGGGSGPVHVLIRFITERKIAVPETANRAELPQVALTPAAEDALLPIPVRQLVPAALSARAFAGSPAPNPDLTLDIPYSGGVDRDRLQSVHRRDKDPDLIVFHHTAMPLKSTFEDIVRVIKSREDSRGNKWITGYNCVVTSDGGVHPFCRWDRYGNHAQGFNKASLGITLNGNFETDPSVPFSNANGKYGASQPTEPQLDAAARVVALWLYVYPDIPIVFDKKEQGIIPHRNVSTKTCPGNVFPYTQFEKLIRHYHAVWAASPDSRSRIEAFKLRPYLYVDPIRIPTARVVSPISMVMTPGGVPATVPVRGGT